MPASTAILQTSTLSKKRRRSVISLTPLIDVVFILLVFFMLASNLQQWRNIELASANTQAGKSGIVGSLLIDVTPDGLRLAGESLGTKDLMARVAARLSDRPDQRILIRPTPGVPMQRVVTLLDAIAEQGALDIALTGAAQQ